MALLPLFQWFETTSIGATIGHSTYLFPSIEVVHLLALTLLLGAVLVVDMRMLGAGMTRQSVREVASNLTPPFWIGAAVAFLTGTVLFLSEAVKCYFNEAFWYKMALLVLALGFRITIHRKIRTSNTASGATTKAAAVVSLALWFGVGIAGRWIGFI